MKQQVVFILAVVSLSIICPQSSLAVDKQVCTDRKISLDLQDTDIDNAFRILAEVCNQNIILDLEIKGKMTIRLIDVPANQALEIFLRQSKLEMEVFADATGLVHTVRVKKLVVKP